MRMGEHMAVLWQGGIVLFAAMMLFYPKTIWKIFYGNMAKEETPKVWLLRAYQITGGLVLVILLLRRGWI